MDAILAASPAARGVTFGLLVTTFWLGFRHGIDYDHIAAITDITSSQDDRRDALLFGTLYALGHALVVFGIGIAAIVAGRSLPPSVDAVMTRIVGVTLLVLGVYVVVSLVRHGRDFRLRSRWMLVFEGVRRAARWLRDRGGARERNERGAVATIEEGDQAGEVALWHHGHHGRPGHHHHGAEEQHDRPLAYGRASSFAVGMIHGVGGETPTQVVLFATAAGVVSGAGGMVVLATFLIGLFASNSVMTVSSAFGFMRASRHFGIYATVAVLTAVFSLIVGTIFVLGKTTVLPALFGG